jgi:AraC family transcriptional regulator
MKYPSSTLLKSSIDLGWSFLSAELHTHHPYEGPGAAAPSDAEVGIVVRGSDEALTYKVAGSWQSARPTTGSIWLRPIERTFDEARISATVEVLHLAVPTSTFARLTDGYLPPAPGRFIRHSSGAQDELINQVGLAVLSEMKSPTSAGHMLVETSSLLLAARLASTHSEFVTARPLTRLQYRLDNGRLKRVLAYVEEHLAEEITLSDLANVACLSLFHFARAFAATVGMPPHRYVSSRRLENAKKQIAAGKASMNEVAFDCRFSSQSSFGRAFRRATGMTPAEYRRKRS